MHFCRSESKSSSSFCPYKSCPDQGNNIPQCNLNFHRKRALRSLFNGHVSPHGGAASAIFGLYEVSCLTLSCLLLNAAKNWVTLHIRQTTHNTRGFLDHF